MSLYYLMETKKMLTLLMLGLLAILVISSSSFTYAQSPSTQPIEEDMDVTLKVEDLNEVTVKIVSRSSLAANPLLSEESNSTYALAFFNPESVCIKPSTTVTWVNNDLEGHVLTSNEFAPQALEPGEQFTHNFVSPGSYYYFDRTHSEMKGTVYVNYYECNVNTDPILVGEEPAEDTIDVNRVSDNLGIRDKETDMEAVAVN
jgi:plastocyanin